MNLATKLRKLGIEVNEGGKEYSKIMSRRSIQKIYKRDGCSAFTKKHTKSRIKEYM